MNINKHIDYKKPSLIDVNLVGFILRCQSWKNITNFQNRLMKKISVIHTQNSFYYFF